MSCKSVLEFVCIDPAFQYTKQYTVPPNDLGKPKTANDFDEISYDYKIKGEIFFLHQWQPQKFKLIDTKSINPFNLLTFVYLDVEGSLITKFEAKQFSALTYSSSSDWTEKKKYESYTCPLVSKKSGKSLFIFINRYNQIEHCFF